MYNQTAEKYDVIFPFNPQVIALINRFIYKKPAEILDIGCGTGKYIGYLSNDHRAHGIDPDRSSISLAQTKYPAAKFEVTDLLSYNRAKNFDLIFSIGNVISHIPLDDLKRFVTRVRTLLPAGGIWMFHTMNWDVLLSKKNYTFPVIENGGLRFERTYQNIKETNVDFITKMTMETGNKIEHHIKLYPQTEATLMDLHSGFRMMGRYGSYAGDEVRPDVKSKVFVFRKTP